MGKVYAKQIPFDYQESPIFSDECFPDNIVVRGNRNYVERTTEDFESVYQALENGEILNYIQEIEERSGWAFDYYKNVTAMFEGELPPVDKKKYSTKDVAAFKKLFANYGNNSSNDNSIICSVLSIVTGPKWEWQTIRGCVQGEWNEIFYPVDEWSQEAIRHFEIEYFNTGTEWIIHDEDNTPERPEDIEGFSIYCYDDPKKEIADYMGVSVDDVVLYEFDGWVEIPSYKEV